jgi:hypothetical protein
VSAVMLCLPDRSSIHWPDWSRAFPRFRSIDEQVKALLLRYHPDGMLPLQVVGTVIWGKPENGLANA